MSVLRTPAPTTLYLCGAGNPEGVRLALTIERAERRWARIVLLDDDPAQHGRSILGIDVAGPFALLREADPSSAQVVNLVARTTARRWASREKIAAYGLPFASLIHPSIDLLGVTLVGDVTAYQHAVLSAGCTVNEGSVIFAGAVVGHGSTLGAGCVLAPGAVTNARVVLEERVYLGTNASVLPELCIGADATVGAGSAVIESVPARATAIGVPAIPLVVPAMRPQRGVGAQAANGHPRSSAPRAEVVEQLARIWRELLELPHVAPDQNFFDIGGTSLLALEMQRRIRATTGMDFTLMDVFRFPSIRELALHLERGSADQPERTRAHERGMLRRRHRLQHPPSTSTG